MTTTTAVSSGITLEYDPEKFNGSLPVHFRVSPELMQVLRDKKVVEPHVLIAVNGGVWHLVPLSDNPAKNMCYVRFSQPGVQSVHATIVWLDRENATHSLKGELKRYKGSLLANDHVDAEGEMCFLRRSWRSDSPVAGLLMAVDRTREETSFEVDVPQEMFAEPPVWQKLLGNLYFKKKPAKDQCQLRRRALVTLPTVPFALLVALVGGAVLAVVFAMFYLVSALITALLLVLRFQGVSTKFLRHPLDNDMKHIWSQATAPVWWTYLWSLGAEGRNAKKAARKAAYEAEVARFNDEQWALRLEGLNASPTALPLVPTDAQVLKLRCAQIKGKVCKPLAK